MAPRVFITGGTGYIGGSVLHTIIKRHPEYQVAALMRSTPSGFSETYPNVEVVHGDYDSGAVLLNAARESDIVIHSGNSDHEASINSLTEGLIEKSGPSFLIHLGGTAIIADWQQDDYAGKTNPKVWNDVADIDSLLTMPDSAIHRNVDKIIQRVAREYGDKIKTAIVCPSDIYGPGLGPGNKHSIWFPIFLKESRERGRTFYAQDGTNIKSWTHVEDLMQLYLHLVEAAAAGGDGADWGEKGYYFASSQEEVHLDVAVAVGKILYAKGVVTQAESEQVPVSELAKMTGDFPLPIGRYFWAANSRCVAQRAQDRFGWSSRAPKLLESLEAELDALL